MAATRILCIGNRFVGGDDFGPRVYDALMDMARPAEVEIVDGGLAGLNLLRYLDDGHSVTFVDAVSGFAPTGEITVIDGDVVARQDTGRFGGSYGHEAGLPFLLRVLPAVVDNPPSRIRLVGCEGAASDDAVQAAARLSLQLSSPDEAALSPTPPQRGREQSPPLPQAGEGWGEGSRNPGAPDRAQG